MIRVRKIVLGKMPARELLISARSANEAVESLDHVLAANDACPHTTLLIELSRSRAEERRATGARPHTVVDVPCNISAELDIRVVSAPSYRVTTTRIDIDSAPHLNAAPVSQLRLDDYELIFIGPLVLSTRDTWDDALLYSGRLLRHLGLDWNHVLKTRVYVGSGGTQREDTCLLQQYLASRRKFFASAGLRQPPASTGLYGPKRSIELAVVRPFNSRLGTLSNPLQQRPFQGHETRPLFSRAKFVAATDHLLVAVAGTAAIHQGIPAPGLDASGEIMAIVDLWEALLSPDNLRNCGARGAAVGHPTYFMTCLYGGDVGTTKLAHVGAGEISWMPIVDTAMTVPGLAVEADTFVVLPLK